MRRTRGHGVVLGAVFLALACGGGGEDRTGGGDDATGGLDAPADGVLPDGDEAGQADTAPEPTPFEAFRIVHGYQGRVAGVSIGQFDLWVVNQDGTNAVNMTGKNLPALGLTCEFGCVVDPSLRWIAVATSAPVQGQFTFKFGYITDDLQVRLEKGRTIPDVTDLQFAGSRLFYSTRIGCQSPEGTQCQWKIMQVDLAVDASTAQEIGVFPPDLDPDLKGGTSTYQGHFQVSPDGRSLVVLSPTIRSIRVYVLRDGVLKDVDMICHSLVNGACQGAGSYYTDRDPVAISHDSRLVAFFEKSDKEFALRLYDLDNLSAPPRVSTLMLVSQGSVHDRNVACANRLPWQFLDVGGRPRFTRDNASIMLAGVSDCTGSGKKRPWTNLYAIDVADIGDGTMFDASDVRALLDKPDDETVWNLIVSEVDFSPGGGWITFTASPLYQKSGELAVGSRTESDREVYLLDPATGAFEQITNDIEFRAEGVFTIPPAGSAR